MLEYGLNLLFSFFFSTSLSGVASLLLSKLPRFPKTSYAWYGFRNPTLPLEMLCFGCWVTGVVFRLLGAGVNDSSSTVTKFEGNRPMARGSRLSLPIHHDPSPAFSASIKSPSMKPRSFFVSPPHEYVALHQHGKRGRSPAMAIFAIRRDGLVCQCYCRVWCMSNVVRRVESTLFCVGLRRCYGPGAPIYADRLSRRW